MHSIVLCPPRYKHTPKTVSTNTKMIPPLSPPLQIEGIRDIFLVIHWERRSLGNQKSGIYREFPGKRKEFMGIVNVSENLIKFPTFDLCNPLPRSGSREKPPDLPIKFPIFFLRNPLHCNGFWEKPPEFPIFLLPPHPPHSQTELFTQIHSHDFTPPR